MVLMLIYLEDIGYFIGIRVPHGYLHHFSNPELIVKIELIH